MNQSNYDNYNYDNYNSDRRGFISGFKHRLKNPVFATAAILLAGAAFAGVIIASYPSDEAGDVPVVQAEATPFKELPSDPGGLDVPFQDSTVYSSLRDPDAPEVTSIENLLKEEEPVDRLEVFAAEAERIIKESEARRGVSSDTAAVDVDTTSETPRVDTLEAAIAKAEAEKNAQDTNADAVMAKAETPPAKPDTLYKPGSSPDTIEFVRDVLEKKDAKPAADLSKTEAVTAATLNDSAQEAASISPASGFDIRPGTHYVQLGSIKSAAAASAEWSKLQKKYPDELNSAKYRVERADLGDRGVFFRIQAGPMAGESANEICGSIKSQTPGGCLVTQ